MFCRLGNPREVFMAITQTLSLLCHRFRHSEYQSQSDDDDDDDTEEEEDESLKGIDWGLAEALIEPLSLREDFFFFWFIHHVKDFILSSLI